MNPRDPNPIIDLLTADEVEPDWLIPEMILQGSFVCLVGESAAGKSYVSYTLALAVAAGVKALSGLVRPNEPKCVLYFDDENSLQDRNKYLRRAWLGLKAANGKEPNLGLLEQNFWPIRRHLGEDDWPEKLEEWVIEKQPRLTVIDTAPACFNIDDENSNAEASKNIKRMKRVMELTDPIMSAWVIKHAKTRTEKGQIRTVRGAKVWKDMSDSVLFQIKAVGRKRKDGLSATRLVPDKKRAYGLRQSIYIDPVWTDKGCNGLQLNASYKPTKEHQRDETQDDE